MKTHSSKDKDNKRTEDSLGSPLEEKKGKEKSQKNLRNPKKKLRRLSVNRGSWNSRTKQKTDSKKNKDGEEKKSKKKIKKWLIYLLNLNSYLTSDFYHGYNMSVIAVTFPTIKNQQVRLKTLNHRTWTGAKTHPPHSYH